MSVTILKPVWPVQFATLSHTCLAKTQLKHKCVALSVSWSHKGQSWLCGHPLIVSLCAVRILDWTSNHTKNLHLFSAFAFQMMSELNEGEGAKELDVIRLFGCVCPFDRPIPNDFVGAAWVQGALWNHRPKIDEFSHLLFSRNGSQRSDPGAICHLLPYRSLLPFG